jgi:divalent metal cation (Fe/Co/Zn/Cd) transporter
MTDCCTPARLPTDRIRLVGHALRLEWLTVGWMVVEAVVAIASGVAAGSLVLLAFGLDSVIELASAGALIWRLSVELRYGGEFSERAERVASRIAGWLLIILAAYVVVAAVWRLLTVTGQEFSWTGFLVALAAIPVMRYLARRKLDIAEKIRSRALRADAMEAIACGWLSFVVWLHSRSNGSSGLGGLIVSARWPSSTSWSKKAAKHYRIANARPVAVSRSI